MKVRFESVMTDGRAMIRAAVSVPIFGERAELVPLVDAIAMHAALGDAIRNATLMQEAEGRAPGLPGGFKP